MILIRSACAVGLEPKEGEGFMNGKCGLTAALVLSLTSVVSADVLVEFSLYTETDFVPQYHVADVQMTIEGIDLMGLMPEGYNDYEAQILIISANWWDPISYFDGTIGGGLNEYEDEGWGSLGFDFPDGAFSEFGSGASTLSMEWSWGLDDDDNVYFSYGLATMAGPVADYFGTDVLYLGWPINETTIPTPSAIVLFAAAGFIRSRRRQ
jgi:hypothetical protein